MHMLELGIPCLAISQEFLSVHFGDQFILVTLEIFLKIWYLLTFKEKSSM